jgi:hypothetical protein
MILQRHERRNGPITDISVLIEIDCYLPDGSANGSVHGRVELLQGKCMKYLRKRETDQLT